MLLQYQYYTTHDTTLKSVQTSCHTASTHTRYQVPDKIPGTRNVVYPSNCNVDTILCDVPGGLHWRGRKAATPAAASRSISSCQCPRVETTTTVVDLLSVG